VPRRDVEAAALFRRSRRPAVAGFPILRRATEQQNDDADMVALHPLFETVEA
jgi:hypothetical protein